jgi:rare lipoprotein A
MMNIANIVLTAAVCTTATATFADSGGNTMSSPAQIGYASWYGRHHAGEPTASGERFNPDGLTCAHRTIPLGAVIRVTHIAKQLSAECRVNDRGPLNNRPTSPRILDLSRSVAARLEMLEEGVARVRLEIVKLP